MCEGRNHSAVEENHKLINACEYSSNEVFVRGVICFLF